MHYARESNRPHSEMPISIGFAEIGEIEPAWEHFQKIYKPYLRPPFNMISEQANITRIPCYLTFAGAALQALLYGFGGFRWQEDEGIHLNPILPPDLTKLEFRSLHWQGKTFNLTINEEDWLIQITAGIEPDETVRILTDKVEFEASLGSLYQISNNTVAKSGRF